MAGLVFLIWAQDATAGWPMESAYLPNLQIRFGRSADTGTVNSDVVSRTAVAG